MVFVYAFFGVLCLGLAPLFGKTALCSVNPITAFALRTVIAAALVAAWLFTTREYDDFFSLPLSFWLVITIEAVLAALLGDLAYFYALKNGNITEVSLIMSCAPLFTIVFSYFFYHEAVSSLQLCGAFFITIGLIMISVN
jgi:transporter family protein